MHGCPYLLQSQSTNWDHRRARNSTRPPPSASCTALHWHWHWHGSAPREPNRRNAPTRTMREQMGEARRDSWTLMHHPFARIRAHIAHRISPNLAQPEPLHHTALHLLPSMLAIRTRIAIAGRRALIRHHRHADPLAHPDGSGARQISISRASASAAPLVQPLSAHSLLNRSRTSDEQSARVGGSGSIGALVAALVAAAAWAATAAELRAEERRPPPSPSPSQSQTRKMQRGGEGQMR